MEREKDINKVDSNKEDQKKISLSYKHKDFVNDPFLEALDEWVWEMDLNGIHTYSNGAVEKILGYKKEEVVGFSTTKLWTKIKDASQITSFKQSLSEGKGWKNYAAYFVHKKGSIKILLSSAIPIYNEQGKLSGYRGIDRDITERVMNENSLKSQKEHIKLINQVLRHDLTNNLSVIHSSIRLYENTEDNKYLKAIKENLLKSTKLIQNMYNLENFILDKSDLKVFSVTQILESILQKTQHIDYEIVGESHIIADEMIYSVFDNIINNAVIHGEATKLLIEIEKEKFKCFIKIVDNGNGIPDEIKERLFEEGFKYGNSGNTGLGLHIVKQAMQNYKGDVSVYDNVPRGTIFKLVFHKLSE